MQVGEFIVPVIDPQAVDVTYGTSYPPTLNEPCKERIVRRLSDAGGLTQFGVHHVTLPPGCWASQRHHHSAEDEFVYILSGAPTLIDDHGETDLRAGDSCAHPAGDGNAHHLINRTKNDVTFLVVGSRSPETDHCRYPDVDLDLPANGTQTRQIFHKDGTSYPPFI